MTLTNMPGAMGIRCSDRSPDECMDLDDCCRLYYCEDLAEVWRNVGRG